MYQTEAESFWVKVDKSGYCWLWTAAKNVCTHHGLFKFRGKVTVQAHRWAYVDAYGDIPDGFQINHHCNNPGCVRPEHLYAGTQADNMRDMLRAGRHGRRGKELGPDKVLQIVARYQAGEGVPTLADEYGVSRNAVFNIVGGRTWSRVTGIPYAGRCERFQRVSAPAPN